MRIKKLKTPGLFSIQVETLELSATFTFTRIQQTISPFVVELKHEEEHKASVRIVHPERFWVECESMGVPVTGSKSKMVA